MTKKDYVKIAAILRNHRIDNLVSFHALRLVVGATVGPVDPHEPKPSKLVGAFADMLAEDNPRFDRDRFYTAVYK